MPFKIERMSADDIPEVLEIDRHSFLTPWPAEAYRREVEYPSNNLYVVLRRIRSVQDASPEHRALFQNWLPAFRDGYRVRRNRVVGYAGLWIVTDEAHITTIAVAPQERGQKLGELILSELVQYAMTHGANWMTLEARVSNTVAQSLYHKYTFKEAGYRRRYYTDDGEDAVVMWTDRLDTEEFRNRFEKLREELCEELPEQYLGARL